MLRFSQPSRLEICLKETYEYLLPTLDNALGYPSELRTFPSTTSVTGATLREEDGALLIRLPGTRHKPGLTFLRLSPLAAQDDYCRKLAGRFVRLCGQIASEAKQSWDIRAIIIREEQFLWDNAILSLTYVGNQKYNALDFLGAARESRSFRYEGNPVQLGLLATWNWYQLKPQLQEEGWTILNFSPRFDLRRYLRLDKASHLLSDGVHSFYVVNSKGAICSWISTARSPSANVTGVWEMVPRAYQLVPGILTGRDLALVLNRHGEIYMFNRDLALKWNMTGWHRLTGSPISDALEKHVTPEVAQRIVEVVLCSSTQRQGALLVVSADTDGLLRKASAGITRKFRKDYLFNLLDVSTNTLCRFAEIDGALIIEGDGTVRSAGVILEVPDEFTSRGEGARTAAASYASTMGVAIKVSHDGPITIFENGKETRRAG